MNGFPSARAFFPRYLCEEVSETLRVRRLRTFRGSKFLARAAPLEHVCALSSLWRRIPRFTIRCVVCCSVWLVRLLVRSNGVVVAGRTDVQLLVAFSGAWKIKLSRGSRVCLEDWTLWVCVVQCNNFQRKEDDLRFTSLGHDRK